MAGIIHKYNKKAKQRDFRTHVGPNSKKSPRHFGFSAIVTKQQFGLESQAEVKNVSSEEKEPLDLKK